MSLLEAMAGGFRRLDVVVGEDETGHGRVLETGRLNFWPVSSLGSRATSSERPRLGRGAPAPVASGVSAIARCTECGQRGGGATSPHHAARMPRRGVCAALAPGAALRGCQYPRTRSGAGSGRPTRCSEPLEEEVAADDALHRRQHLLVPPRTRVSRIAPPARQG